MCAPCVLRRRASYLVGDTKGEGAIDAKRVGWHMQRIDTFDFDVFGVDKVTNGSPLVHTAHFIFWKRNLFQLMGIQRDTFLRFVNAVQRTNDRADAPFHNSIRTADMVHAVHVMLGAKGIAEFVTPRDMFVVLVAAIVSDLGHPGFTNRHCRMAGHATAQAHGEEHDEDGGCCALGPRCSCRVLCGVGWWSRGAALTAAACFSRAQAPCGRCPMFWSGSTSPRQRGS